MRILRGLKKEEKCIFYGQKIYIKNREKKGENGLFGQIVQTESKKAKRKIYVWTNCPNRKRGEIVLSEMKTEMLRVRMSPEDKQALYRQARRNQKTMSEYIRAVAKRPPDITRDEFDASIVRMIYEINKIGVNINQIAKKYNEHKFVKPSEDLLNKLDEVSEMMRSTILILQESQFEE